MYLPMSLEMQVLSLPVQQHLEDYKRMMTLSLPDKNIIRWYIATIEEGYAKLEVVYEQMQPANADRSQIILQNTFQ